METVHVVSMHILSCICIPGSDYTITTSSTIHLAYTQYTLRVISVIASPSHCLTLLLQQSAHCMHTNPQTLMEAFVLDHLILTLKAANIVGKTQLQQSTHFCAAL